MISVRRDRDIHAEEGGWFSARWHFSFGSYRDPAHMGLGPLRVFNDDRLIPGAIWPMHPHRDIEGITYVVEGTFRHADSLGGGGVLRPGAIQRMTLGSGAEHSEQNGAPDKPMRFLQLWLLPDVADLPPGVEQRQFTKADRTNRLRKVVGPEGGDVVKVHADAGVWVSALDPGVAVDHDIGQGRGVYAYLIAGAATFDDEKLSTGDAATVRDQPSLAIRALEHSELILVDAVLDYHPVGVWARTR